MDALLGDPERPTHGEIDSFLAFNRNKRSAEADLRGPRRSATASSSSRPGRTWWSRTSGPGVMARLGLAYEDVRAVNPRIVYASLLRATGSRARTPSVRVRTADPGA